MGVTHTKLHHRVMQENWPAICRRLQTAEGQRWVQQKNPNGDLPIHLACYGGHAPPVIIRALVASYPESIDVENNLGFTPIQLAASNYRDGHPFRREVLSYLGAYAENLEVQSYPGGRNEQRIDADGKNNSINNINKTSSVDTTFATSSTCVVCLDEPADHVVAPCGHMCLCGKCAQRVRESGTGQKCCPMCRSHFDTIIQVCIPLSNEREATATSNRIGRRTAVVS